MPITKKWFEKGLTTAKVENLIVDFLRKHDEYAYQDNELASRLRLARKSGRGWEDTVGNLMFLMALTDLVRKGKVVQRKPHVRTYFTIP